MQLHPLSNSHANGTGLANGRASAAAAAGTPAGAASSTTSTPAAPVSLANWNISYTTHPAKVVIARDIAHVQVRVGALCWPVGWPVLACAGLCLQQLPVANYATDSTCAGHHDYVSSYHEPAVNQRDYSLGVQGTCAAAAAGTHCSDQPASQLVPAHSMC
jgi:hypothetical protein